MKTKRIVSRADVARLLANTSDPEHVLIVMAMDDELRRLMTGRTPMYTGLPPGAQWKALDKILKRLEDIEKQVELLWSHRANLAQKDLSQEQRAELESLVAEMRKSEK